jgi:glycosyltransferase involved in cell wall biosynthesis
MVIVGTGDGLPRLQTLAAEAQLEDAVTFTGWVDHAEIPGYLAAADVAIYPYRDSLVNRAKCSIKILEYMTAGKAIVTHRVGQNTEYLENGRSAILADPGDVDEFAQGLLAVLSDRALSARLGREAALRIHRHFTWDRRIADVETAYQCALAG